MSASLRTTWVRAVTVLGLALGTVSTVLGQDRFSDDVTAKPGARATAPLNSATPTPVPLPRNVGPTPPPRAIANDPRFAAVTAMETEDFGVMPPSQLRGDPMHAPTPTQIPGGSVITTETLQALLQQKNASAIVFDVLGAERGLPGAQNAQPAGAAGSFNDPTQREFGNYLGQVTRGNKDVALIFYCQNVQCWRSYNAALRAIKMGFTKVYWYRGGIEAWTQAGLPTSAR